MIHRLEIKESEKPDMNLAGKLKKLWNMRVAMIAIVFTAIATVYKGLEKN